MRELGIWLIEHKSELLACFLEILMVLICLHGMFKSKFKLSVGNTTIMLINMIVVILINMELSSKILIIVVYLFLFIYCVMKFRCKMLETIGRFLLSLFFVSVVEVFSSIIVAPILDVVSNQSILMVIVNGIGLLLIVLFVKIPKIVYAIKKANFKREEWILLMFVCGFSFLFVLVDYRLRGDTEPIYYILFLTSCIVVCLSSIMTQKAKHELEKNKFELELQKVYGDTYKELISEVRRKQHDFNNQLSALYSMHLTATSLEDLAEKQSAYGKVLLEENRYDKILVGCNNSILAGYLYYRCVAYEKDGVLIDYQVHVDGAECVLSLHEIIELLGILLTNAYEHCKMHGKTNKIGLTVEESPDKLSIEVSNQTEPISSDRIAELFKEGKSSKGKERGIGLARVKQLTDRVKADLIVENKERENNNWINFRIMIPKYEVDS